MMLPFKKALSYYADDKWLTTDMLCPICLYKLHFYKDYGNWYIFDGVCKNHRLFFYTIKDKQIVYKLKFYEGTIYSGKRVELFHLIIGINRTELYIDSECIKTNSPIGFPDDLKEVGSLIETITKTSLLF